MNTTIKAIETVYKGYRFRSRLEARWAVFFDALGVAWEYEPEGFETSAGRYLPDFLIRPKLRCGRDMGRLYVEVKAAGTTEGDWAKPKALAHPNGWLSGNCPSVLLLAGPPSFRWDTLCLGSTGYSEMHHACRYPDFSTWNECFVYFDDSGRLCFDDGDWYDVDDSRSPRGRYAGAVAAALSARFEHGETPR